MGAASFEKLVGEPEDKVKEKQPPNEKKQDASSCGRTCLVATVATKQRPSTLFENYSKCSIRIFYFGSFHQFLSY